MKHKPQRAPKLPETRNLAPRPTSDTMEEKLARIVARNNRRLQDIKDRKPYTDSIKLQHPPE